MAGLQGVILKRTLYLMLFLSTWVFIYKFSGCEYVDKAVSNFFEGGVMRGEVTHKICYEQIETTKGTYKQYRVFCRQNCECNSGTGHGMYFWFISNKLRFGGGKYCGKIPKYITGRIIAVSKGLTGFIEANYKMESKTLLERKGG